MTNSVPSCYEARLSLGLKSDGTAIIGSLDGISLIPIQLTPAVKKLETNTTLKFDQATRSLVFENERSKNGKGSPDYVSSQEILSGALVSELGGVNAFVEGGLASVRQVGEELQLDFEVPAPVQNGEVSSGFITYVPTPNANTSHYKLIKPDTSGSSDTLLIGHPDGSIEFTAPIASPVLIPANTLTSGGDFSGTPATASGSWRYQEMGTSTVIQNTSRSSVQVTLQFRYSLETLGSRSGVYATLVNGGADYKTSFVEGPTTIKQEGYPGGMAQWSVVLSPNQKCQFKFGAWTNAAGTMVVTIGSVDENNGTTIHTVVPPTITIRRLI